MVSSPFCKVFNGSPLLWVDFTKWVMKKARLHGGCLPWKRGFRSLEVWRILDRSWSFLMYTIRVEAQRESKQRRWINFVWTTVSPAYPTTEPFYWVMLINILQIWYFKGRSLRSTKVQDKLHTLSINLKDSLVLIQPAHWVIPSLELLSTYT